MNTKFVTLLKFISIPFLCAFGSELASAAEIKRSNNTGTLSTTGVWTGGVVPGPNDVAVWDNVVSTVGRCTNNLGADLSWAGIKILNPSASPEIGQTSGTRLYLGASGVDLNATTNTQNLNILPNVSATNSQSW